MRSESAFMCVLLLSVTTQSFCDVEQTIGDEIHYEDSDTNIQVSFTPQVNMTKCANQTICNDVLNYPESHVLQALRGNTTRYNRYLSEDKQDARIFIRFKDMDEPLCESAVQLEEPKAGRNKDDEWMFIVNHGEYKQAVEVRVCTNENKPCRMAENFPFRTECRQKYILRKMLALNPNDGVLKEDSIKLPSCCSCRYFNSK